VQPPGLLSHLTFRWAHRTQEKLFWEGWEVLEEAGLSGGGALGAGMAGAGSAIRGAV